MARIRTIKPAFFRDLAMCGLPIPTRLTFIGLWTYVDDEGRGVDDARLVKAELWPLDDKYTVRKVTTDLEMLFNAGRICRYEDQTGRYLHIIHWNHQRINRPQPSLIPHCACIEHSVKAHPSNSDHSVLEGSRNKEGSKEGKGAERRARDGSVNEPRTPPRMLAPHGPAQVMHTTMALVERRDADLAAATACGQCDRGWIDHDDGSVTKCVCQNGGRR